MLSQRHRPLVEPGVRVDRRVTPVRHRDQAEVLAGRPVVMHVAPGDHGDGRGRHGEAHRVVPAVVHPTRGRGGHRGPGDLAEPVAGALVQAPVAHHDLRSSGRDRHRGELYASASRATPVAHLAEERELAYAQLAGERDLSGVVHCERDQAVHVRRSQPGVGQRRRRRLGRQPQLAAPGVLRELGGPDPGDRRRPGDHAAPPAWPAGRTTRTVPVTWSPRRQRPVTSTRHSPSSCPVTRPENVSVSPA